MYANLLMGKLFNKRLYKPIVQAQNYVPCYSELFTYTMFHPYKTGMVISKQKRKHKNAIAAPLTSLRIRTSQG
jgi:hypothetical protein